MKHSGVDSSGEPELGEELVAALVTLHARHRANAEVLFIEVRLLGPKLGLGERILSYEVTVVLCLR